MGGGGGQKTGGINVDGMSEFRGMGGGGRSKTGAGGGGK